MFIRRRRAPKRARTPAFQSIASFRHLPIFGLFDTNQTPRTLLHRIGQVVQVLRCRAQVFDCVINLVIICPYQHLHVSQQLLGLQQGTLQISQIPADWLAYIADGAIHVLNGVIGMLAQRVQLIGKTINLGPFSRQHFVDVIQDGSNPLLIGFPGHGIQVGKQTRAHLR